MTTLPVSLRVALDARTPTPREPRLATVFRRQFALIDMAQRFPLLVALLAMSAAVGYQIWPIGVVPDAFIPLTPMLLVTLVWPLFVWYGEGPTQRLYHRAMPVPRLTHDWIKIAAGASWLMLAVGLVSVTLWVVAASTGYASTIAQLPFAFYLTFFTSTLLVYLFGTMVPLLTDRPLEWLLGSAVAMSAIGMLHKSYRIDIVDFVGGTLQFALVGMYNSQPWARLLSGGPVGSYYFVSAAGQWLIVTIVWFSLASAAICWASGYAVRKIAK